VAFLLCLDSIFPLCLVYETIIAIEHAKEAGYKRLWLESDSTLVCFAFSSKHLGPRSISNIWNKYLYFCKDIDFKVSYIFREDNHYVDKLASLWFYG